jgi:hypothetical protein
VVPSDLALGPVWAALGATKGAGSPRLTAAPPVICDSGSYHETWWIIAFDSMNPPATADRLRAAMVDQVERVGPLFGGGDAALRPA